MTKEVPRTSVLRDEELIARLRSGDTILAEHYMNEAADRIEALSISNATLIAERDALFRRATLAEEWRDHDKTRAEAAEAKLAECEARLGKAVEALGRIARQPDYRLPSPQGIAQEALAEIKGEVREVPVR